MRSQFLKWLKILLPLLLGVLLMWWIYSKFSPEQIDKIRLHFREANYIYVLISIVFAFLSHLSRAYRWNYLLQPMGYTTRFRNNVMAIGISYIINLLIPRSGEVSRALIMQKYENIPFEKAFGTIFAERAIDLIILFLLAVLAFSVQYQTLKEFVFSRIPLYKLILVFSVLLAIVLLIILYSRTSNSKLSKKIRTFIEGFKTGILSVLRMKKAGLFILHTVFIWTMYLLMFYITFFAIKETAMLSFPVIITSFVVGGLVIAFTNGGFGYYPIFIAQLLLLFDVPYETGTAFGWIAWTSQFIVVLTFGLSSFILLPILNKKSQNTWQK